MIHVFGSSTGLGEYLRVGESIQKNWMGAGPVVQLFEKEFAAARRLNDLVMVSSGSSALHLAVHLLNLPPESDVIIPSFTWVACAQAVALCGHRPVFCDVDYETQNVTAETVKAVFTKRTKAVMVVHYAGRPVDLDPIMALGEPVIEDAAHAVVSDFPDGKACGAKGAVGIFSYDAVKNLACPEGGGLTGSKEICQRARDLRYCGVGKSGFASTQEERWWEPPVNGVFPKVLCNDVCAGIALEQLRRLPELQAKRDLIWDYYQSKLSFVSKPDQTPHSRFTYLIRCKNRDKLAHHLKANGVYSTLRYAPLHHLPIYNQQDKVLPNTERLSKEGLNIPLHPGMTLEDAEKVVDLIHAFYS